MTVWWAQYIRVREPESTMGSAECAAVPCREPLACYVKHSEQLPRVRCAAMCTRVEGQCARARTAECRVAPFRGCGPKKQSISLLPTGRRSFSFIDSCPPILVPCPVFLSIFLIFHFISGIMSAHPGAMPTPKCFKCFNTTITMVLFCESLLGRKGVIVGFVKQPWLHISMMFDGIVSNILM